MPKKPNERLCESSVLTSFPIHRAARGRDLGHALNEAKKKKEKTYFDLVRSSRCRLLVMGFEVGGRWSDEAFAFVKALAWYKSQSVPRLLRRSAQLLFQNRWTGLMCYAVQNAYAASLLGEPMCSTKCVNGPEVFLGDLDQEL